MIKQGQWGKWLLVFFLMSFFTLFLAPISQYALGNTINLSYVNHEIKQQPNKEAKEEDTNNINNINNINIMNNEVDYPDVDKVSSPEMPTDPNVQNTDTNKKPVYLTIDDGPGITSGHILDILERYQIQATFFVVEPRVRYYPEIVARMAAEGHELGVHGVTHDVKRFYASASSAVDEFNRTRNTLELFTGQQHYLARTPYGSFPYLSKEQERLVLQDGYKIWDWNVDSRDWFFRNASYVQNTISQLERLEQNATVPVILIHELETTARHLPLLIDYLITNDYEFKTLNLEDKPVRLR